MKAAQVSEEIRRAEVARATGDEELVMREVGESLALGQPYLEWIRFALRCRDTGGLQLAEQVLTLVIQYNPESESGYFELAFLHRLRGDHRKAAALLQKALSFDNDSFRVRVFLAHMLYAMGAHSEASGILNKAKAHTSDEHFELDAMFAFGRYLAHYPLGRALMAFDDLRSRYEWLEAPALAEKIKSALRDERPFAMVRFGDGEGSALVLSPEDEFSFRPLYERNRNELFSMWFGHKFDWKNNGFFDLARSLIEATTDCDVIGVPYESWLTHEYTISSPRGVSSLVNVHRAIAFSQENKRRAICSQMAHLELYTKGYLAQIIAGVRRISLISCLDELPKLMKQRFDLDEVTFYRIPGEQGSQHILGATATQGTHYPDVYYRLQDELAQSHRGQLFLVAGGILGKFYAATIRRHGGVALDIGSIVDAWMGHMTRPGYDEQMLL